MCLEYKYAAEGSAAAAVTQRACLVFFHFAEREYVYSQTFKYFPPLPWNCLVDKLTNGSHHITYSMFLFFFSLRHDHNLMNM